MTAASHIWLYSTKERRMPQHPTRHHSPAHHQGQRTRL
jgi:hypothetical protein